MAPHFISDEDVVAVGTTQEKSRQQPTSQDGTKQPLRTIYPFLELEERPIDEVRPVSVIVVGSGMAGITAGILLPRKVPGVQLTILEKTSDIGGTWNTNIYPNVRCDVPSTVYQSSYAPNTKWTSNYAPGAEIKAYWSSLVDRFDVRKLIKFNSEVLKAEWSSDKGKWVVEVRTEGAVRTEESDFLITATGTFSLPKLPEYPGIETYKGHLRHSSNWDPTFEPEGKTIAVIGNGASGLQVVPPLQQKAKQLYHFARSRTWIAGSLGGENLSRDTTKPIEIPQDPVGYTRYRKELENNFFSRFPNILKGHEKSAASKALFEKLMADRLGKRSDLLGAIRPDFSPSCRRLTPGPGYLEAITQDNVEYVAEKIERFTPTGIVTVDGKTRDIDAVICSTGADISFSAAFPIIAHGIDLQKSWRPGGNPGFPDTYLGIAAPDFPNLFLILGANSNSTAGTVPFSIETHATYISKILRKVSTQGIRTITPSRAATNDFRAYCESFMPRTVMSEKCSSWYNGGIIGGRIHGIWPGSGTHALIARREVRWEDFEYTYLSPSKNRFAYFGNGWAKKDVEAATSDHPEAIDFTTYLREEAVSGEIDLRGYLEEPWYQV
ncbi:hypothetical protein HYFRA_00012270 [Hymenoscyphus fraxineus]|uniref:FAD/NAD(P)-binding domain-containing protein n=1 Tax=Hymenoscyphus fraxineus TaxID=746836 RepID=A0A9N9KZ59_9HELO|nr:hypothetical protein HYFRA_00012270 [Hymenoscyphus fraxineus]